MSELAEKAECRFCQTDNQTAVNNVSRAVSVIEHRKSNMKLMGLIERKNRHTRSAKVYRLELQLGHSAIQYNFQSTFSQSKGNLDSSLDGLTNTPSPDVTG